jgi:crossover junction endodeoxyribonuclease RusA
MIELQTTMPGLPRPQGSMKPLVNRRTGVPFNKHSDSTIEHRNNLIMHLRRAWGARKPLAGAVTVMATFGFERPKSHYKTGKSTSHLLRDDAPLDHIQAPDTDKLQRLVGDALEQAGVVDDDSQISNWLATKVWVDRGGENGTAITVASRRES